MTTPTPFNTSQPNGQDLWWTPYLNVQKKYDTQIRSLLLEASKDAQARIDALSSNTTFSAGVRAAQLRMVIKEVKTTFKSLFAAMIPVIGSGQKDEAVAAATSLSKTDREYLEAAFRNSGDVASFIRSQQHSASIGVVHAISRITQSEIPLSARVYRTQALATGWVSSQVNVALARNASAQDIAKTVKSNILPTTPGGASYAALRLGRTELNNAFHATAITLAQDRPWITGMRWHLSAVHTVRPHKPEICEQLAGQIYDVDDVPPKPHPQCRCYVSPEVESIDVFNRHLTAGQYRDWMEQNATQAA